MTREEVGPDLFIPRSGRIFPQELEAEELDDHPDQSLGCFRMFQGCLILDDPN